MKKETRYILKIDNRYYSGHVGSYVYTTIHKYEAEIYNTESGANGMRNLLVTIGVENVSIKTIKI